jgi:mono/diheme cytochrome c family protein
LSTYDPNTNFVVGDQMPDVGSIFTDAQIWNLVKFLKAEAIDVNQLYNFVVTGTYPTGSIVYSDIGLNGDAASGATTYAAKCAGCHGANGTAIIVDGSYHVGSFIRAKPNEAQHKIKFGQLGSMMGAQGTTLTQMRNLYRALSDPANFPD